ncbi:hypothetical protein [Chitinophaga sp.]|uniref:hypothetical protein n=1 Tax=Chitinophaga sp. TaxID=1869181 RepID=UPI0031DC067D
MEQPTIFEEQFGTAFLVRRRSLLSTFLKIYIWAGVVIGGILFILTILSGVGSFFLLATAGSKQSYLPFWELIGGGVILSGILISMTLVLWFEVKWAIRYNWVMGGIWILMMIVQLVMPTVKMGQINGMVLTIPYWIMIYQIQRQWEQAAVSKKEMSKSMK